MELKLPILEGPSGNWYDAAGICYGHPDQDEQTKLITLREDRHRDLVKAANRETVMRLGPDVEYLTDFILERDSCLLPQEAKGYAELFRKAFRQWRNALKDGQ